MTRRITEARTISIVGNGPVSEIDAPKIDKADVVLRFNSAPSCGAAGQRVDILLLNRARVYMSKRINPIALHRAKEVWINDRKENGEVDWLFERECEAHYLGFSPIEKARSYLERYDPYHTSNPTTGAAIIAEFMDTRPDLEIHLFGFTHQGKQHTHDWDAEKRWIGDLIEDGHIFSHRSSDKAIGRTLSGKTEYWGRFLEKRIKHYYFNKFLHSGKATKSRLFGVDG